MVERLISFYAIFCMLWILFSWIYICVKSIKIKINVEIKRKFCIKSIIIFIFTTTNTTITNIIITRLTITNKSIHKLHKNNHNLLHNRQTRVPSTHEISSTSLPKSHASIKITLRSKHNKILTSWSLHTLSLDLFVSLKWYHPCFWYWWYSD